MYRNYEKRVKDFVIDMTNPESIIEHKDITEKVTNTRAELINEQFANNPEKNRPLVFRGYISEADRIKDVIKNHRFLYYLPDYEKIKQEQKKMKTLSQDNKNNMNRLLNAKYTINNNSRENYTNNPATKKKYNISANNAIQAKNRSRESI